MRKNKNIGGTDMKKYQTVEIIIDDFSTKDVCTISTTPDYSFDIFEDGGLPSEEGGVQ